MVYPFIADMDIDASLHLAPYENKDGKQKVEIFRDGGAGGRPVKFVFNLCADPRRPLPCRYRLDTVREDQDGSRRGLAVKIQDEDVLDRLKAFDEAVVSRAIIHSKEWFKKELTEEQVRLRYKPLIFYPREDESDPCIKFKVKCRGQVLTKLHFLRSDDFIVPNGATIDHLCSGIASVAPILSVHSIWFMGGGTSFGLSLQAEEMVVQPPAAQQPLSNFCSKRPLSFVSKEDDEEGEAALKVRSIDGEGLHEEVKEEVS